MAIETSADVVIVGGGIAGSALALVLSRRGVGVTVLERQVEYADRVRGEYMQAWGVAEARRLEILDILAAAGGFHPKRSIPYDETIPPEVAEKAARDTSTYLPGVPGPMTFGHPAACRALSEAAETAGARVVRGSGRVTVTPGMKPSVEWEYAGEGLSISCRLVVGADGRTSTVRGNAGMILQRAEPEHLISGMLVDGAAEWPQDAYSIGTQGDTEFFVFPQGGQRLRLYTCTALDQRDRYAGSGGPSRFLEDFRRLTCVPQAPSLANATPIGPCATLGGEDTWVDVPLADGVALIGDAAGYNNPIIGEGLSLALRDVRLLSDLLLAESDWSPYRLVAYADERRERMRRLRFSASLMAAIFTTFGPDGAPRPRFRSVAGSELERGRVRPECSRRARVGAGVGLYRRIPRGGTSVMPERTPENVVRDYVRAWAIADESQRMAVLERCWTDSGVYADPYALVEGRSALSNHIAGFHRARPGHRIPLASGVEAHHGYVRFQWVMLDASGQQVGGGFDIGELAPDGRLERITGFFGPFPEIPADWPDGEVWRGS